MQYFTPDASHQPSETTLRLIRHFARTYRVSGRNTTTPDAYRLN